MLEVLISVSLSSKQLCAIPYDYQQPTLCYNVAVGCPNYPTPEGLFEVKKAYTNAQLISFHTNENLGSKIIGSTLIDLGPSPLIKGTRFAIHGWHKPITDATCSHSCIRMSSLDITNLLDNYSFKNVSITQ